jgi:hypothetical protein
MSTHVQERDEFLTAAEVAAALRVDVASVYRAVGRGDLPAVRLSEVGAIRIPARVLDPKGEQE